MNRKLKLALAALLGFSAACSSVKNVPAKGGSEQKTDAVAPADSTQELHRIIVMYGVRPPQGVKTWSESKERQAQQEQLDPVAERAGDDMPAKAPQTPQSDK